MDEKVEHARRIVDQVLVPRIEADLKQINDRLKEKYGVHVGIKIDWFFQSLD